MSKDDKRVLIAGGGPVGLFAALLLGRSGLPVRVFDSNAAPQEDPRAATTHPGTLELLGEAGLVEDMGRIGLIAPTFQFWDRVSGQLIAEFDHSLIRNETKYPFVIQCEQFKTAELILSRLQALDNVEVLFSHEVTDVAQDADRVTVSVKAAEGEVRHTGRYLIGADGGRSIVRKKSGIPFEGFTWPERFIVLTTPFDFGAARGYSYRSYFADPDEWCNCFKVAGRRPPGLWRTVYPANANLSEEELLSDEAAQVRLQKFFPNAAAYEVIHRNLYTTHQRVAKRFRAGRVLLAGDSAHVNNPIGGMGLNGGLQDAANLADKLSRVMLDNAPEELLDLYDHQRRTITTEFVQQQTIANKKRLEERDPVARQKNLDELARIADDPEQAKKFLLRSSMIFSQRRATTLTLPDEGLDRT